MYTCLQALSGTGMQLPIKWIEVQKKFSIDATLIYGLMETSKTKNSLQVVNNFIRSVIGEDGKILNSKKGLQWCRVLDQKYYMELSLDPDHNDLYVMLSSALTPYDPESEYWGKAVRARKGWAKSSVNTRNRAIVMKDVLDIFEERTSTASDAATEVFQLFQKNEESGPI